MEMLPNNRQLSDLVAERNEFYLERDQARQELHETKMDLAKARKSAKWLNHEALKERFAALFSVTECCDFLRREVYAKIVKGHVNLLMRGEIKLLKEQLAEAIELATIFKRERDEARGVTL